jgi:hypothetical protein
MAESPRSSPSPERAIALYALVPGTFAAALAFAFGSIVGLGVGASAAIGVAVAVGGFCAQVLALGWARGVSANANMATALFGFILLLALVAGVYAALRASGSWFSPKAFGGGLLALIPVAAFETFLTRRGRIAELIVDADRAATAARSKGRA